MIVNALGIAAILASAAQAAPVQRTAGASVTILRPLSIAATAALSFGRLQPQSNDKGGWVTVSAAPPVTRTASGVSTLSGGGETPAIRDIVGEPGRAYRVTLPASVAAIQGGYPVTAFKLWSANWGDITATGLSQLSSAGRDTIRIGATITFPKGTKQDIYTANVPITISYE